MKLLNSKILLILIIIFGSFLRIYNIDSNPPGIHADESDTGYSAYSILNTGITQYGTFSPLAFDEFNGGTHPPLYTYALIPLVHFFGLSITVERLPSVIFGILTIPIFYYLVLSLFKSRPIALICTLFLALNPWAIHMSRQGLLEAIALFTVTGGVLFFLLGKTRSIFYILAALFLGLSLHAYDAPKIFVPLFLPILIIFNWKSFTSNKKILIASSAIFLTLFLLMLYTLFFVKQVNDYGSVSIFNSDEIAQMVDEKRYVTNAPLWLSSIAANKPTVIAHELLGNFFDSLNPNWYFTTGTPGNFQRSIGKHGQFYLFEFPLILLGAYILVRKHKKLALFLTIWFIIGIIPGTITKSGNIEYRNILMLPIPLILSALGLYYLFKTLLTKKLIFLVTKIFIIIIIFISILNYLYVYFLEYPAYATEFWSKQQNEAIEYAESQKDNYTKVYIDSGIDWLSMYGFIYKIDPTFFQNEYLADKNLNDVKIMEFDNLVFGSFILNDTIPDSFEENSLIITNGDRLKNFDAVKYFYGPGEVRIVFKAVEYNKSQN